MRCEGLHVSSVVVLVVLGTMAYYTTSHLPTPLSWFTPTCTLECVETYFAGKSNLRNPALIPVLRDKYLHPPPATPNTAGFDIYRPPWRELLNWYKVQETLKELWEDQGPGVFVEVGAVDGEFMSQTLVLEKNLSWTGLLIEPDPRSYRILQERRRNAWTSPTCVYPNTPSAFTLWMRDLIEDLPQELQGLVMARSKLSHETTLMDMQQGKLTYVTCVPLSRLLLAANMTHIDLLTIATGTEADQMKIKDVIFNPKIFTVKTLLIHYPRSYLLEHPYPIIRGYIHDTERSQLLVRLYWRISDCQLLQKDSCRRSKHYDLVDSCLMYRCMGFATVWTFDMESMRTKNTQTQAPTTE